MEKAFNEAEEEDGNPDHDDDDDIFLVAVPASIAVIGPFATTPTAAAVTLIGVAADVGRALGGSGIKVGVSTGN